MEGKDDGIASFQTETKVTHPTAPKLLNDAFKDGSSMVHLKDFQITSPDPIQGMDTSWEGTDDGIGSQRAEKEVSSQIFPKLLANAIKSGPKLMHKIEIEQGNLPIFSFSSPDGTFKASSSDISKPRTYIGKRTRSWGKKMKEKEVVENFDRVDKLNQDEPMAKISKRKGQEEEGTSSKTLLIDKDTVIQEGRSGGLAIFWKDHIEIDILSADKNLLDLKASSGSKSWFLSCVYGPPLLASRHLLWNKLSDIGSTGNGYTWGGTRNKQWIQSKLDRCFGNSEWFTLFPISHQWFLEKLGSDHRPVLVRFINDQEIFRGQFKFDKRWAEDPCLEQVIHSSWNRSTYNDEPSVLVKIAECRRAISSWKKQSDTNSRIRIARPSYAWRSILFARRPVSLQPLMNINLKVHQLIDPRSRTWKLDVLQTLFPLNDVKLILQQQPWSGTADFYCWSGTPSGIYDVQSGYKLSSNIAHKQLFYEAGESPSVNPILDSIWHLHIPSKIQLHDSPISQPPQMSTPPADYDDMSEALPSFHGSSADDTDVFTVPGPRPGHRRRHLSEHSHSSLHSDGCVPSMGFTNLEPGESSKRKSSSASPTVSDQRLKKKYPGLDKRLMCVAYCLVALDIGACLMKSQLNCKGFLEDTHKLYA
ncbi:unnamed protein product [Arabidopsis arenosa]|uniref:Uncharacterized protein n=1 Tax=Arabidopsis arenosa TaxID=38785 RepID=A0A8S2AR04_ARAAE|nr:unnamed protein product [Arabidopsis arenosa]